MDDQALETNELPSNRGSLFKYIEPAILLAALTGFMYLIGIMYVSGYFGQLGIFTSILGVSADYYLVRAIRPLLVFVFPAACLLYVGMNMHDIFYSILVSNLVLPLVGVGFLWMGAIDYPAPISYLEFFIGSVPPILYVFLLWRRENVTAYFRRQSRYTQVLMVVSLFVSLLGSSIALGMQTAKAELDKSGSSIYSIEFKWKQSPPSELQGKELDLVMYSQGKYYVVPFESPAPQFPKLYVIPDDQIEYAVTQRVR